MAYKYTEEEVWGAIHVLSDMRDGLTASMKRMFKSTKRVQWVSSH